MSDIDIRFFLAFLAPTVGFAIWFVKRIIEQRNAAEAQQEADMNFIRALYAEIDFNTRDMEIFNRDSADPAKVRDALMVNPDRVPHVTDARHTQVYRDRIHDLHIIEDGVMHKTIYFYGLLEKILVQAQGFDKPSYKTLSDEGRVAAVELMRGTAVVAERCGKSLLKDFEQEPNYEGLGLARFDRDAMCCLRAPIITDVAELKKRLAGLETRLQNARETLIRR